MTEKEILMKYFCTDYPESYDTDEESYDTDEESYDTNEESYDTNEESYDTENSKDEKNREAFNEALFERQLLREIEGNCYDTDGDVIMGS